MALSSVAMSRAMSGKQIRFSDYELTVMSAHPVDPGLMKVGGCRHAADACCPASRGVAPTHPRGPSAALSELCSQREGSLLP